MALKRKDAKKTNYEKHILTMKDLQDDICRMADGYSGPIMATMLATTVVAIIGLILVAVIPGAWRLIHALPAITAILYGASTILKMKGMQAHLAGIGESVPKGNFSVLEDTVTKSWVQEERIGIVKESVYYISTRQQKKPIRVPAVTGRNASPDATAYLIRDAVSGTICTAYLESMMTLDQDLKDRILPLNPDNLR